MLLLFLLSRFLGYIYFCGGNSIEGKGGRCQTHMKKYWNNLSRNIIPVRHRVRWKAMIGGRCDQQSLCARQAASLVALLQRELGKCNHGEKNIAHDDDNNMPLMDKNFKKRLLSLDAIDGIATTVAAANNIASLKINASFSRETKQNKMKVSSGGSSSSSSIYSVSNGVEGGGGAIMKGDFSFLYHNFLGGMEKDGVSDACFQQVLAILDSDNTVAMHECSALALETLYEALLQVQSANMQHEQEMTSLVVRILELLEDKLVTKYPCDKSTLREHEQFALLRHLGKGVELLELQNKKAWLLLNE